MQLYSYIVMLLFMYPSCICHINTVTEKIDMMCVSDGLFAGVSGEAQRLLVAPSNTSVIQGQAAILRCQVGAKKGALQWTKDGFALGTYTRIIYL